MIRQLLYRLLCRYLRRHGSAEIADETVTADIRSRLAKIVRHPRLIEVTIERGCVLLRGPILMREIDRIIDPISRIEGVRRVEN